MHDEGDFEVTIHGTRWVGEAKARQALSIQAVLADARKKAKGSPALVIWKRLVTVPGKTNRQPVAGERVIVALSMDDFIRLIEETYQSGRNANTEQE